MRKFFLLLSLFFGFASCVSHSYALSDLTNIELDCYHVTNNSSESVRYQFQDGNGGWSWSDSEYAQVDPGQTIFFSNVSHYNSYNPRILDNTMNNGVFMVYVDCRDVIRSTPSDAWTAWYNLTHTSSGSTSSGSTGPVSPTPVDITGYFSTPVSVSSGSYNWNMTLNLSQSGHIDAIEDIQLWNAFHVDSATPSGNTIVLALSPTASPLSVDCGTYTVTIPSSLIQGNDGVSANPNAIIGSFSVVSCPVIPLLPSGSGFTATGTTYYTASGVTFSDTGATYLSVFEVHNGVYYLNIWGVVYIMVFLSVVVSIFYGLFKFYLNFTI